MTAPVPSGGPTSRVDRERRFHDDRFGAEDARSSDRFYAVNDECEARYEARVLELGANRRVLEIGCGLDSVALALADAGAHVTGIDISPVAIGDARGRAGERDNVRFEVMDAEALEVDDNSVDLVIGTGILHHLDLAAVTAELRRVLVADGRGVFVEPLGHNPVINLYRRLTPGQRTSDEHPLLAADFEQFKRDFATVKLTSFVLLALLAIPFQRFSFFDGLVKVLQRADRVLFEHVPRLRPLAWTVLIELAGPRPIPAAG